MIIIKVSFCKRGWGDQLTFASQKNVTQIPRSKSQKSLKTFLEPEFIEILKNKLQATMTNPVREYN